MKVGHVLDKTWTYRLGKFEACPSKTEGVSHECPISGSTVPFLVQLGQQEKLLALREFGTQSSRRWHANQVSGELQFGLCLKLIAQIFAENQVSHFWSVPFPVLYSMTNEFCLRLYKQEDVRNCVEDQ